MLEEDCLLFMEFYVEIDSFRDPFEILNMCSSSYDER